MQCQQYKERREMPACLYPQLCRPYQSYVVNQLLEIRAPPFPMFSNFAIGVVARESMTFVCVGFAL